MRTGHRWIAALLLAAGLGVAGCAPSTHTANSTGEPNPATVENVPGSDTKRVTLTQRASERLGIETVAVREVVSPAAGAKPAMSKKVIPYIAVIYDTKGDAWVYTVPQALTYVRHRVVIERVAGDDATLSDGPPTGTTVVTKGVAELYGAELGVGK